MSTRTSIEPLLLSVIASRMESAVRDMTNTLLRSARSTVINTARDFSCSLLTADGELLFATEALPVHVIGSDLLASSVVDLHADVAEGDAFLHNDPYLGNSHPADHAILVPVFHGGRHLFTVCAKAHQADCGNTLPTTYSPWPVDVYQEGALIFPCVRIQRKFVDEEDVIRTCRARIRVPDQWYGDYLASLGAARIGERRLQQLFADYGIETIGAFVADWLDYSERCMIDAIGDLPEATVSGSTVHDPVPGMEEGIPLKVTLETRPASAAITVDLTDNPDNYPGGLNESQACSTAAAIAGVFNVLGPDVPLNAGSFRRIDVRLRRGCIAGIPEFPHSCSMATTDVFERIVGMTQMALAALGDGYGLAEGAYGQAPHKAVISGRDPRRGGAAFVNQIFVGAAGGPGTASCDGWPTYQRSSVAGLMFHDSVEVDEQRYPIHVEERSLICDSGGAGRCRGGLGGHVVLRVEADATAFIYVLDGNVNPPQGVRGGGDGGCAAAARIHADGTREPLPGVAHVTLAVGERIESWSNGGGGYGDPMERDAALVLGDVLEGWVSLDTARERYGVAIVDGEVDEVATQALRRR